jgi:uncharacterized protein YecT (DUF1311 family)
MIRTLLALAALMLFAPVAQAASFDCAKASTAFENAICNSPDLSKQDEVLAQAYATALGGLSTAAASAVKADQHGWLDYAARACSDDAQPIAGAYTADQATCLGGEFTRRITDLEASKMQGGYRFYPVEKFLVERDPDAETDSYNKVATKHFLTVKIDRDDDLAAAFNAMTETLRAANDLQVGEDTHLFDKSGELAKGDTSSDIDLSTTVKSVGSSVITLVTDFYWYGHGAAHGNYGRSFDHFLVEQKRALVAADVFKGEDWKDKFAGMVIDKAKADLGDEWQGDDSSGTLSDEIADPSHWEFDDAGITVLFNPYDVASYARAIVEVTVPWDQLQDMVTDTAQSLSY